MPQADAVKVSTMRQIDAWVGTPVCFVLTVFRRCGDLWRLLRKPKPAEIRRILFIKLAEQGALVLAYPAIHRAIEMVGRENVYFLVFDENRFVLDVMEVVPEQNIIGIPTSALGTMVAGTVRALRRLRKLQPDAAIDFEFFARSSAVLTYLSGAGVRVGLHAFDDKAPYRGDLMTHRLRYDPHLHTTEAFATMVEALNVSLEELSALTENLPPAQDVAAVFDPQPQELAKVKAIVQRQAGTSDYSPLVLLNANASDLLPLRRWPPERYVELAQRLIERSPDVHVAFTGAPDEAPVAGELVAEVGSDRCFSMAGKTTLRQLLVLYCLAELLVTNDSGPAHFATLTPIHVITLFGPETPALFGSRSPRAHILWKNIPCSPCVNAYNNRFSTCKDNQCLQQITVQQVFDLTCEILGL